MQDGKSCVRCQMMTMMMPSMIGPWTGVLMAGDSANVQCGSYCYCVAVLISAAGVCRSTSLWGRRGQVPCGQWCEELRTGQIPARVTSSRQQWLVSAARLGLGRHSVMHSCSYSRAVTESDATSMPISATWMLRSSDE